MIIGASLSKPHTSDWGEPEQAPTLVSRPRKFLLMDHARKTTKEPGRYRENKRTYRDINGAHVSTSLYVRLMDHLTDKYTT